MGARQAGRGRRGRSRRSSTRSRRRSSPISGRCAGARAACSRRGLQQVGFGAGAGITRSARTSIRCPSRSRGRRTAGASSRSRSSSRKTPTRTSATSVSTASTSTTRRRRACTGRSARRRLPTSTRRRSAARDSRSRSRWRRPGDAAVRRRAALPEGIDELCVRFGTGRRADAHDEGPQDRDEGAGRRRVRDRRHCESQASAAPKDRSAITSATTARRAVPVFHVCEVTHRERPIFHAGASSASRRRKKSLHGRGRAGDVHRRAQGDPSPITDPGRTSRPASTTRWSSRWRTACARGTQDRARPHGHRGQPRSPR